MKLLRLLFFVLISFTDLSAQDSTFVTVKAGYKVTDVLTQADIYFYPQFTNGKVFLKSGEMAGAKMNYTRLYDQMLFIDPKGDTLAIADENTIKFIIINKDTFYYSEGYMKLIADDGVVKLTEKQIWVVADVRKVGTHDRATGTVAITSLASYNDGRGGLKSKDLILNENTVLQKKTEYYFGDKYNLFVLASKKRLLQLFPKDHRRIEDYLKENKVNFNKKDDLEKLSQFLSKNK